MNLSKTLDYIPHDLLIAKLHAYGFNKKAFNLPLFILKTQEAKC